MSACVWGGRCSWVKPALWWSCCLTYMEPHPPMENHLWFQPSGRGDIKKALCFFLRFLVTLISSSVTVPQVHLKERLSPSLSPPHPTRRPLGPDLTAQLHSALHKGGLAVKCARAARRCAQPLFAPGATSELGSLPTRVRPPGSHSPSRTGSERVNLWSPGDEYKQWVAVLSSCGGLIAIIRSV